MSWQDQNEFMRLKKKILNSTESSNSEKSMISQIASGAGIAYNKARDVYVERILDPMFQNTVRNSMDWLINANFVPEFVNEDPHAVDFDDSATASDFKPDNIDIPKRMFNLNTGNLEEKPSGQYVILSHNWKGDEITYAFISKIRESKKKKEAYEMVQDDDEEAMRFAKFKAKKFKHLEAGKTDLELLIAQCDYDIEAQTKKIDTILSRSGIESNTRDLLVLEAKFMKADWEKNKHEENVAGIQAELKLIEMAIERLQKKIGTGVSGSETPSELVKTNAFTEKLVRTRGELNKAKGELEIAEESLARAKAGCEVLDKDRSLRSAVKQLLPILERKKSSIKIEKSFHAAKNILDAKLFPQKGGNRYLWNDTCCINRADTNEYNESLAMMGQWYSNADLCLVYLDTPNYSEWVDTWDKLEQPEFCSFKDVKARPTWATRGWTLQEQVLSKMAFWVNNIWQPLPRSVEGLGPYYYHCSYLYHHIGDRVLSAVPQEAKLILENKDLKRLQAVMKAAQIECFGHAGCEEKWRRLIGILDFLEVNFPRNMDDDNSSACIRKTISHAAHEIKSHLTNQTPNAPRLTSLFGGLGFTLTSIEEEATNLIKCLVRVLVKECKSAIDEDREKISEFTLVSPEECSRGLKRSIHPASDILALASHRTVTVPIDAVYSLMGVLGVKFAAFHAEGTTKALSRLLDEVVVTSNDISIFNWAGKDMGSPIRGRSLYPSKLEAFNPHNQKTHLDANANDELAKALKQKRDELQDTASRLNSLLRAMIKFVKDENTAHTDVPVELMRSIIRLIKETELIKLRPQLENLAKLSVYFKNTPRFEEYKPTTLSWTDDESTKSVVNEDKNAQASGNITSRFGIKTPQIPQIPQIPQFSAPKLKVGGLSGFYGKKSISNEPELTKESSAPTTQPPAKTVREQKEPKTLIGEVNRWISTMQDVQDVPDEFKPFFDHLEAPNLDEEENRQTTKPALNKNKRSSETAKSSPIDKMICPNPITLTTSGIEAVLDIQRVIITMQDEVELRRQVERVVNESEKIVGQCTIRTGISTLTASFSCAAVDLRKQLGVCDVVQKALEDKANEDVVKEEKVGEDIAEPTQTSESPTPSQENTGYYNKLTSLSSGFLRQGPQTTDGTKNENIKQDNQEAEAQKQSSSETKGQKKVAAMLDFVQETDINLIVGEWVLARFTGAEGAKWFLCQLELGSTHNYYGRRIATDEIDFKKVAPEPGLEKYWKDYMENKKTELCGIVEVLVQGRDAGRYFSDIMGPGKKNSDKDAQTNTEVDDDSDNGGSDPRNKLMKFVARRGTDLGGIVQSVTDKWGERLDEMLSDTILQKVPKEFRAAIMNLNDNEDLLPAMFMSGVKVHMF